MIMIILEKISKKYQYHKSEEGKCNMYSRRRDKSIHCYRANIYDIKWNTPPHKSSETIWIFWGKLKIYLREACVPGFEWISGKFPNGLWPPPFSENFIAIFSANSLPKLPFLMQKKLQWNFLDRKWPPPPFRKFSGNSFESGETGFP